MNRLLVPYLMEAVRLYERGTNEVAVLGQVGAAGLDVLRQGLQEGRALQSREGASIF